MASFSIEEFVGNGILRGLVPKLLEEGWDDVPTLKIMSFDDMDSINMTQQQKDALEIRSYLHDRSLMQYGDKLELSGKNLPELLGLTAAELSSQFGMKRGHIARFTDKTGPCTDSTTQSHSSQKSFSRQPVGDGKAMRGIVAAGPAESRACGCVNPPAVAVDQVAPYSTIESISVQRLAPEHKIGTDQLVKSKPLPPPMKASELWRDKPALLLCVRRPGCIMCRAEAHNLYAKKPVFDSLGIQMYAVLHENLESEVKEFWPRYWGGAVVVDAKLEFFRALGGGELMRDKFLTGFVLNPRALANYRRAKGMMGLKQNLRGEGEIKGGLFVVGTGTTGVAYQFIERNFGDWAPIQEVIDVCTQLQQQVWIRPDHPKKLSGPIQIRPCNMYSRINIQSPPNHLMERANMEVKKRP